MDLYKTAAAQLSIRLQRLIAALDRGTQAVYHSAEIDFRPSYFAITRHLMTYGEAAISELSLELCLPQPAVSRTLDQMRGDGLVELQAAGEERRARIVKLTPKATSLAETLQRIWTAVDRAGAALEEDAGSLLSAAVDAALVELEREPFFERVRGELMASTSAEGTAQAPSVPASESRSSGRTA